MTNEDLILRLCKELYDLKQKLHDIGQLAEVIYKKDSPPYGEIISIINLIDTSEIYEN